MRDVEKEEAPIRCPNSSRWIEIAGGLVMPAIVEPLLMHAAICEICGPRLKEAVELLGESGSEAEDEFVMRLESSQPAWQAELAERLASAEKPTKFHSAFSFDRELRWFAMNWRLAAMCATGATVGLVCWFTVPMHQSPGTPMPQIVAGVKKPEEAPKILPAQKAITRLGSPQTTETAYLTLEPGLTRGIGRIVSLNLTNQIQSVLVTVRFDHPPPKAIHIELMTDSNQKTVWNRDLELTEGQIRHQQVDLKIPAKTMIRDDYTLLASERTENGTELIDSYAYRVNR